MTGLYIFLGILGAFVLLMAIAVLRSMRKKPVAQPDFDLVLPQIDAEDAIQKLQQAVRIPTITVDEINGDPETFLEFHRFLEERFPIFHQYAKKTVINRYSLIYEIEGSDPALAPACFLAHQDVVPPQPDGWTHEPFSGDYADGYIWGRGSFDMKSYLIAVIQSLESLLAQGFRPKRSIYCCFGHDEETSGKQGAKYIARHLIEKNIHFEYVLDEGMTLFEYEKFLSRPVALIGISEKGFMNVKVTAKGAGGHASVPPKYTAAVLLSKALVKINRKQMKTRLTEPTRMMIKNMTPHLRMPYRIAAANFGVLYRLVYPFLGKIVPARSIFKSTMAPTMLKASSAPNVLPVTASAIINCRINTGETSDDVLRHIQKTAGKHIKVEKIVEGMHEPTKVSSDDTVCWKQLDQAISKVFHGAVATPFPFVATTDSKHFAPLTENIYRFSPFFAKYEDRFLAHNIDERFSADAFLKEIEFFMTFIKISC